MENSCFKTLNVRAVQQKYRKDPKNKFDKDFSLCGMTIKSPGFSPVSEWVASQSSSPIDSFFI